MTNSPSKPTSDSVAANPGNKDAASAGLSTPKLLDWILLGSIIVLGGSAFALIQTSIETLPPLLVTVVRLWIGALLMTAIMFGTGRRFPPLFEQSDQGGRRIGRRWVFMALVGAPGTALPFFIFPWAQQYVESGLAGIYMAFMPIWTLGLAAVFTDEKLTGRKLVGFLLGLAGAVILLGPAALSGMAQSSLIAQIAVVFAALCYAGAAVITRRAPFVRPRVFAAGNLLAAAISATPALLFVQWDYEAWSISSMLATIALGIFPTGIGSIVIVILIQRVGASFMSYANYLVPLWAIVLGAVLFGERLSVNAFIALGVVSIGLAISQGRFKR